MDLEIRRFDAAEHFVDRLPKCRYFPYGGDGDKLTSGDDDGGEDEIFDFAEAESLLIDSVVSDDKAELVAHAKGFVGAAGEDLERSTAAKLLHFCCYFDTAALAHSARRVDVLLKRHARTILRTIDGLRQLALDLSLCSTRMNVIWNLEDHTVENLVNVLGEKIILMKDPDGIQCKTELQDAPLFFAVKNRSMVCVEILLSCGANNEFLNLRPVDLTILQDMLFVLLIPTRVTLSKKASLNQHKCFSCDSFSSTSKELLTMTDEDTAAESTKVYVCTFFDSPCECVREATCFYAHGLEQHQNHSSDAKMLKCMRIFVGGLAPSVNSDSLGKFFEKQFGPVVDSVAILAQTENKKQSRGFGFVTFKEEKSVSAAVQVHYVTMAGKPVEIKNLTPRLAAKSEKMSPVQQETEKTCQYPLLAQMLSNKLEMEANQPEQASWNGKLLYGQPKTFIIKPQEHISNRPKWIKIFKKWFPRHLQDLLKNPNNGHYALSSLTTDFQAKFGLQLDYKSLGFSKMSEFVKSFSNLCTIKIFSGANYGSPTHMVIQPNPSPRQQICHTFRTPCASRLFRTPFSSLLSALTDDGGNSKCLKDFSSDDDGDSNCLEDISLDSTADSKCLQDLSLDVGGGPKCLQDLLIDNGGVNFELKHTNSGEEKPFLGVQLKSANDTSDCVHSSFLQFLKPDPLLNDRKAFGVQRLVLEPLTRKWNKSPGYFLGNFDFYKVGVEKQTGTTNVVFLWQECAFVGVDSRGTSTDVPRFILQDDAHKIAPLDYNLLATMHGASDYCNTMLKYVHDIIVEHRKAGKVEDALAVANHARRYIKEWRLRHGKDFPAGSLIVGYGGDGQLQVHPVNGNGCDNHDGDGSFFVIGSGKTAAEEYKSQYPDPMVRAEAIRTVERALLYAALEDPLTGGSIKVHEVKRHRCDTVSEKKVLPLILEHYDFIASRLSCCMIVLWFECYLKYDSNSHKLVEEALNGFVHGLRNGVILARLRTCTVYMLKLDAESTIDQVTTSGVTFPYNVHEHPDKYPHMDLDIPPNVRNAGWLTLPIAIEGGNMPIICTKPCPQVFECLLDC